MTLSSSAADTDKLLVLGPVPVRVHPCPFHEVVEEIREVSAGNRPGKLALAHKEFARLKMQVSRSVLSAKRKRVEVKLFLICKSMD